MNYLSAEQSLQHIKSHERVFIHGGCATPHLLVNALTARSGELENVEITHLHTEGEAPYARPEYANSFHVNAFFTQRKISN